MLARLPRRLSATALVVATVLLAGLPAHAQSNGAGGDSARITTVRSAATDADPESSDSQDAEPEGAEPTDPDVEGAGSSADDSLPPGDSILRLATLLPSEGPLAEQSLGQRAAIELAVRQMNAAGGVLGKPVELLHRDSGAESADAAKVVPELAERGVDVVFVGSVYTVQSALSALAEASILVVSISPDRLAEPDAEPSGDSGDSAGAGGESTGGAESTEAPDAASTPDAETPDADAISIAAPSLIYAAAPLGAQHRLAALLAADRGEQITMLTSGGVLGAQLLAALALAPAPAKLAPAPRDAEDPPPVTWWKQPGAIQVDVVTIPADAPAEQQVALAGQALALDGDVLLLDAADATITQALLPLLLAEGLDPQHLVLSPRALADLTAQLPEAALDGTVAPASIVHPSAELVAKLRESDPWLSTTAYAVESFDAAALVALAAEQGSSDNATAIRVTLQAGVDGDGLDCTSIGECLYVLSTEPQINYLALSGLSGFDEAGHPSAVGVTVLGFTGPPRPMALGLVPVSLGGLSIHEDATGTG